MLQCPPRHEGGWQAQPKLITERALVNESLEESAYWKDVQVGSE